MWTTGSGWGSDSQSWLAGKDLTMELSAAMGELRLKELIFSLPPGGREKPLAGVTGSSGKTAFRPRLASEGGRLIVKWDKPVVVQPGADLALEVIF